MHPAPCSLAGRLTALWLDGHTLQFVVCWASPGDSAPPPTIGQIGPFQHHFHPSQHNKREAPSVESASKRRGTVPPGRTMVEETAPKIEHSPTVDEVGVFGMSVVSAGSENRKSRFGLDVSSDAPFERADSG